MKIFDLTKIKEMWEAFLKKDPLFLHKWDEEHIYGYGRRGRDNQLHENIYHGYSHDPYYLSADSHMLIEDVHTGVMPYLHIRDRGTGPTFSFSETLDPAVQRMVFQGISDRNHPFELSDACTEFIRETTHLLMTFGHVAYELVYESQDGVVQSFSFESIPDKYLFKVFGSYYQIIPWWVAKKARTRVGVIRIPANKVLFIDYPAELGGERRWRKILARVYALSKELFPEFTMESMKNNEETGFDTNEYAKTKYLEVAKLTKPFGWNQRSRKNNYTTEFYYFKRHLDYQLTNVVFREHILGKLNAFLNGSLINLGANIEMHGYATRDEIAQWRSKMETGGLKFLDMFNDLKDR